MLLLSKKNIINGPCAVLFVSTCEIHTLHAGAKVAGKKGGSHFLLDVLLGGVLSRKLN